MTSKFTLVLSLIFFSSVMMGQGVTLLQTISEGDPNSLSGLGYSFSGKIIEEENLYFRGSKNGLTEAIWETDGTVAGTHKIIEEGNGISWSSMWFLDEVVIVKESDGWSFLEDDSLTPITDLPNEDIRHLEQSTNNDLYIATRRDNNIILHASNNDNDDLQEIGEFHPSQNSLVMTVGTEGAMIFNDNPFVEDFPKVYLKASNEIVDINEYLSQWFTVSSFNYAYLYDKYMFTNFNDGNNFAGNYIIDMELGTYAEFQFIREPISYTRHNGNLFMVTKSEVVKIDESDLSSVEIYDDVFPFSTSLVIEDKVYINGDDGDNVIVVEIDMNASSVRALPGTFTGDSFYDNKFEVYKDEFYYISKTTHSVLHKYDFDNDMPVVIDTLSTHTGASVNHALVAIGDHLVISKRPTPIGHELYVYNSEATGVTNLSYTNLEVLPTIAENQIQLRKEGVLFQENGEVQIIDMNGKQNVTLLMDNGQIDVSNFSKGMYVGVLSIADEVFKFTFLKQ